MSGFRFATHSETRWRRWSACLLASLALHAGLALALGALHPEHPFPTTMEPIAVQLLREPAPARPRPTEPPRPAQKTAPSPPRPAQTTAPSRPRPARTTAPAPPRPAKAAAPAPPPKPPAPDVRVEPPSPLPPQGPPAEAPAATSVTLAPAESAVLPAPARDFNRIFQEGEVDRIAAPGRPIRTRYPERERRRGREGTVLLKLTVGADGAITEIEIVESAGKAFDQAAMRALRRVRFTPAIVSGRPVASELRYRLRFALR